ncbi:hypothetical protein [Streptomyces sp. HNM0574]|uniref:hypothetical protein n=1 Tax=Streptomyces sp. HNM0574 TaxID=2714954 RepID=UPI00146C4A79|nr:hypothetical protein [Streptomyces sp. HNM0574]NLU69354.1 hypothetical protein [Streptomyces sp. HNM0574]
MPDLDLNGIGALLAGIGGLLAGAGQLLQALKKDGKPQGSGACDDPGGSRDAHVMFPLLTTLG